MPKHRIRIVNMRSYKLRPGEVMIKIDRSSPVGNPYLMQIESDRQVVCQQYEKYFNDKVHSSDTQFVSYLNMITNELMYNDVALGCWCMNKEFTAIEPNSYKCHGETIVRYALKLMQ